MGRTKGSKNGSGFSNNPEYYKTYMKEYYQKNKEKMDTQRRKNYLIRKENNKKDLEKNDLEKKDAEFSKYDKYGKHIVAVSNIIKKFENLAIKMDDNLVEDLIAEFSDIHNQNKNSKELL